MAIATNMVVSMEYELREKDGSDIIDSNVGEPALEFIVGKGHIISGLEEHILTMNDKESAQVEVVAAKAYGDYDQEALDIVPKEQFGDLELSVGMPLYAQSEDGQTIQVTVKAIKDDEVTIDYNHALAGKDLVFDITILSVREATSEELESGIIGGSSCDSEHGGGCGCSH